MNDEPSRGSPEWMKKLETGFNPSVKACKARECVNLIFTVQSGVRRRICAVNGRIPGNLADCPLDEITQEEA